MTTLLTGASGFLGSNLLHGMRAAGVEVLPVYRRAEQIPAMAKEDAVLIPSLEASTDWSGALKGASTLVHCAGLSSSAGTDPETALERFRTINVEGTLSLARQAADSGVQRFVFISSLKVNGERTPPGRPFTATDSPSPEDPYGIAKAEAEEALMGLAAGSGMAVVIIRPPLIYGPGVKGNLRSLIRLVERGLPLPLGAVTTNRRSLISTDNLVDLALRCLDHPAAANQVILASDGEDLSTASLIKHIAQALSRPARLVRVPEPLLQVSARLLGRAGQARRLLGSLQVDLAQTCKLLDWQPPLTVVQGMRRIVEPSP